MDRLARAALAALLLASVQSAAQPSQEPTGCPPRDDAERTSHRSLRWDDFAGPAPASDTRRGDRDRTLVLLRTSIRVDALAIAAEPGTDGGFRARVEGACVQAYVLKRLSGRARGAPRDSQLRHEQLHFDLTEAFARELRERLTSALAEGSDADEAERALRAEVGRLYREVARAHEREQQRYDRETSHGQRAGAQARWTRETGQRLGAEKGALEGAVVAQRAGADGEW